MEIDKAWNENVFVTKANLMHNRVHDPERKYSLRGKKVFTSVPVYHDGEAYNLYGITDCIEATVNPNGKDVLSNGEKYHLCIVEYKPTQPKNRLYNEDDMMQVFAQKICVDYVFQCDSSAVLYYADTKERVELPFKEHYQQYDRMLKEILEEMRCNLEQGIIPPIRKGQKCSGCSMKDLCMPKAGKHIDIRAQIEKIGKADI